MTWEIPFPFFYLFFFILPLIPVIIGGLGLGGCRT